MECRRKPSPQALERLRNYVANTSEVQAGQAPALAYAIYVLARNGKPVMEDLRYLADAQLSVFQTPLARAQLAASLALLGDRGPCAKGIRGSRRKSGAGERR